MNVNKNMFRNTFNIRWEQRHLPWLLLDCFIHLLKWFCAINGSRCWVWLFPGADTRTVDHTKGKHAQDWARKTGRYETLHRLHRLKMCPKAEQFCESYAPEWPELRERVARATARKSTAQKIRQCVKNTFGFRFPHDPEDNGCMDHMVRITTGVHSYLVSTGCRPLCPTSPPEVGRQRLTVPELVKKYPDMELDKSSVCHWNGSGSHTQPSVHSAESSPAECCAKTGHRGSMLLLCASTKIAATLIPRSMARRNSVFPSRCIPKISVCRPSESAPKKEKTRQKMDDGFLEPPKWKYKESMDLKKQEKKANELNKVKRKKKTKWFVFFWSGKTFF